MQNSQALKPYIIQQLYHKSRIIPQTYKSYSILIACKVNASVQTILQDHGFKQLHHACKWSQGRVVFMLQKSELTKRKIWTNDHGHSPSHLASAVAARQERLRKRGWHGERARKKKIQQLDICQAAPAPAFHAAQGPLSSVCFSAARRFWWDNVVSNLVTAFSRLWGSTEVRWRCAPGSDWRDSKFMRVRDCRQCRDPSASGNWIRAPFQISLLHYLSRCSSWRFSSSANPIEKYACQGLWQAYFSKGWKCTQKIGNH